MRAPAVVWTFASLLAVVAAPAAAQDREADFLFGMPRGALGIRAGYMLASANSDLFDFIGENLTIESSDFNAFVFGVDVAITLSSRVDLVAGFEVPRAGVDSEYRDFVEDNDQPILQSSSLTTVPLMGSLKLYLGPRGRDISRFAFLPAKVRPYVGGGGGLVWYRFTQTGDFVDFQDLTIFTANLQSDGAGLGAQVFGGTDIQVGTKVYVNLEARYLWASAGPSGDFVGFDSIDLGGLRMLGGINLSF